MPVILGKGNGCSATPLRQGSKLVDHRLASTGAVVTVYKPPGAVPHGSFADATPSEAERARSEQMARGDW